MDDKARTPFQRAVLQLEANLILYQGLEHTLEVPGSNDFRRTPPLPGCPPPEGVAAVRAKEAAEPHADEAKASAMVVFGRRYMELAQATRILAIPPDPDAADARGWRTSGQAILESFGSGRVASGALAYAGLGHAWHAGTPKSFNKLVSLYRAELAGRFAPELRKSDAETRFNAAEPFYLSLLLYLAAFIVAILSWLKWPEALGRAAFWLVVLAWVVATAGIATRMWLEGRPPVTNLYSSALFVGWGSVGLCLVLESVYRNAIGSVAAGLIGFGTLLIAHQLALSGDTLEMMRAVLDSNFWLATHVVVVTTGYASTFLAGFLALIYIVRGVFTRSLDRATADSLARMVYGIVCFATLFSFVGTVLGGIWADQSWGRFWGWDPKENGALIIVLWNALILHCRWGGLVRQRGLMSPRRLRQRRHRLELVRHQHARASASTATASPRPRSGRSRSLSCSSWASSPSGTSRCRNGGVSPQRPQACSIEKTVTVAATSWRPEAFHPSSCSAWAMALFALRSPSIRASSLTRALRAAWIGVI